MPPLTDIAICLRRWDYSETSQTVSLFTREHGVLRGLAKGSRRERGKFSGGFDVLTRGQVVAYVKAGRDLATLAEWHLVDLFRFFRERLDANRAGLLVMDLLHHLLTDHDPHPQLFDRVVAQLEAMRDPAVVGSALLAAQWSILEETGYRPQLNRDAESGAALPDAPVLTFDPRAGGVISDPDAPSGWRVRQTTIELLREVADGGPARTHSAESWTRANRLLATYAREIAGRELPSLRWAFGEPPNNHR